MVHPDSPATALAWLATLANFERRPVQGLGSFDLSRVSSLLRTLGHPERGRRVIHITGTKGKGTVAHFCDAILRFHVKSVMRYTSPHLDGPNERIVINGENIGDAALVAHIETIRKASIPLIPSDGEPTWFEVLTTAAWMEARAKDVDVDVLEVGLGGRLDTTNVTQPTVSVVTSIGLDHCAILGHTHDAIASEKGGIIKAGVPVVLGLKRRDPGCDVLRQIAHERGCRVFGAEELPPVLAMHRTPDLDGAPRVAIETEFGGESLTLHLRGGATQALNARIAMRATALLLDDMKHAFDPHMAARALAEVAIPARCEWFPGTPATLVDGAHTSESSLALTELAQHTERRPILAIVGLTEDRNGSEALGPLARVSQTTYCVPIASPRSQSPEALAGTLSGAGFHAESRPSVVDALRAARHAAGPQGLIVIAGSFFLAAEARRLLWAELRAC